MKKTIIIMALMLSACTGGTFQDDGKVHVTTTVGMLGDMVENVGGDLVAVDNLMGPGVDPHLYKPSAGDISALEDADVVFYAGLHLEGKMVEIFETLSETHKVVELSEEFSKSRLISADPEIFGGSYDPHVWFDVSLWSEGVDVVKDALVELDPENEHIYIANAAKYENELVGLHDWAVLRTNEISEESKLLVTAHDAFGYFGRTYGLDVRGIQGISTSSDYGLKDLEVLIDLIVERKVKAVFVESSVPKKSIEALQEGVRAKGWEVEIGGELFSDAMGNPGTLEGTYIGMVKHNVNTIVDGLK